MVKPKKGSRETIFGPAQPKNSIGTGEYLGADAGYALYKIRIQAFIFTAL